MYNLIKYNFPACHLGSYCWFDPVEKKYYRFRIQILKRLVIYIEKGGVFETHKDIPDKIQEKLYLKKQQRQEKNKSKSGKVLGIIPYPSININILPFHSVGLDTTAFRATADPRCLNKTSFLKIPGFRDIAVKEYGKWLASTVSDNILKAAFRQACNVILSDGFDLEHIHKDQNPEFFVGKGVKPGIARIFVENIRDWVENVKRAIPLVEVL